MLMKNTIKFMPASGKKVDRHRRADKQPQPNQIERHMKVLSQPNQIERHMKVFNNVYLKF